jgi:hypothetical protein
MPEKIGILHMPGLNRHDAIHAIASVLMGTIFDVVKTLAGR